MANKIFTRVINPDLAVVNTITGEIESAVATVKVSTIDEFIFCFLKSIPQITSLDGNTMRVLMWCWKFSSFNPNIPEANYICNDVEFKENIRREGGDLSNGVIDIAFHDLCKKGFLVRKCRGRYLLNPNLFFKGTLSNRSKLVCNVEYNPE